MGILIQLAAGRPLGTVCPTIAYDSHYLVPYPPELVIFPMGMPRLMKFMGFWVVRGLKLCGQGLGCVCVCVCVSFFFQQ